MRRLAAAGLGITLLLVCFAEAGRAGQPTRFCHPPWSRSAYPWPVKPFDRQHPIRGAFGDPRTLTDRQPFGLTGPDKVGAYSFHNGVDIAADAGAPVYPVVSGRVVVAATDEIVVRTVDGRSFQYYHLTKAVHRGQVVTARRTILGSVQARFGHVHLAEINLFRSQNPLERGHLTPYRDRTRPAAIGLYVDDGNGPHPLESTWLGPRDRLAVAAADPQPVAVPGPWLNLPHAPALVEWRLFHDRTHTRWQTVVDFRKTEPPPWQFWTVYAPGTYQNSPVFEKRLFLGSSGLYLFRIGLEPARLPVGDYRLQVRVADVRQNRSSSSWRLQVPPKAKAKRTHMPIWTLAMDGSRVAYMSGGRVHVWNVVSGVTSTVSGSYPSYHESGGRDYGEVAIAGRRVALITRFVTGRLEGTTERLYTAALGGRAHQLNSAHHETSTVDGSISGKSMTGLVGSGSLLAVSTWNSKGSRYSSRRLSLVSNTGLRPVVTGPGAVGSLSAAGRHIAVLRSVPPTGVPTVGVYAADGRLLREIGPSSATDIALSGHRLVVLTKAATLEVYDWTTGKLLQTRPVAATIPARTRGGGSNLAVYGRFAVVTGVHRLHLLDLRTGRDSVIASAADSGYNNRAAAIGPLGLVYAANSSPSSGPMRGRLVFLPANKLLRS